jgi:hypothetical protein
MCMENLSQCNDRRLLCLLTKQLSKVGAACSLWLKGPRQHILLCVLMQPCFPSCTCNATSESRTTLQMQTTSSPACIPDSEAQHSGLLGKSSSHYAIWSPFVNSFYWQYKQCHSGKHGRDSDDEHRPPQKARTGSPASTHAMAVQRVQRVPS